MARHLNHFERRMTKKAINANKQTQRALHGVASPRSSAARPVAQAARPFSVFQGTPMAAASGAAAWAQVPLPGPENDGPALPWAGARLAPSRSAPIASTATAAAPPRLAASKPSAPLFAIFEDSAKPRVDAKQDPFALWTQRAASAPPLPPLPPLSAAKLAPELANLSLKPRTADFNTPAAAPAVFRVAIELPAPTPAASAEPEVTFYTRQATDDLFGVFASPSMHNRPPASARAAPPLSFETPAPSTAAAAPHENWSPNATTVDAVSTRRRPLGEVQQRPALSVVAKRDELAAPSFRALVSSPRAVPTEGFAIFQDDGGSTFASRRTDEPTFQGSLSLGGLTESFALGAAAPAAPPFMLYEDLS